MSDQKGKIIIKKVKKVSGGGSHGGSWKVAYADFVTAMMAFFLLLWLLSMVAPEKRIRLSTYFKHFSIFEKSGTSFMEKSSELFSESGESQQKLTKEMVGDTPGMIKNDQTNKETAAGASSGPMMSAEQFKDAIKQAIEEKLSDIKDQVTVEVLEGGVRIQLVDKAGKPMFDVGSSEPTPLATRIMQVLGDQIKGLPNTVSVEGHTDSLAFRSSATRGNWELSTERALAAKKQLEGFGLNPNHLIRIAGYADTVPYIKDDPKDPRNRRISIILLFPKK